MTIHKCATDSFSVNPEQAPFGEVYAYVKVLICLLCSITLGVTHPFDGTIWYTVTDLEICPRGGRRLVKLAAPHSGHLFWPSSFNRGRGAGLLYKQRTRTNGHKETHFADFTKI